MCETAKRIIQRRIEQHKANLDGWREGVTCPCVMSQLHPEGAIRGAEVGGGSGEPAMLRRMIEKRKARATCVLCSGTGRHSVGFLVPTEPDPDERDAIRRRLQDGIAELELILKEIGA